MKKENKKWKKKVGLQLYWSTGVKLGGALWGNRKSATVSGKAGRCEPESQKLMKHRKVNPKPRLRQGREVIVIQKNKNTWMISNLTWAKWNACSVLGFPFLVPGDGNNPILGICTSHTCRGGGTEREEENRAKSYWTLFPVPPHSTSPTPQPSFRTYSEKPLVTHTHTHTDTHSFTHSLNLLISVCDAANVSF